MMLSMISFKVVSFSACCWLYRKSFFKNMDVLSIILYPETLVSSLINSNNVFVNSFFPHTHSYLIWKWHFSFLSNPISFLSLSFLTALLKRKVLNRSCYRRHHCFVHDLSMKDSSVSPLIWMVPVVFSFFFFLDFIRLRKFPSVSRLLRVFVINICWSLIFFFIETIIWFFSLLIC